MNPNLFENIEDVGCIFTCGLCGFEEDVTYPFRPEGWVECAFELYSYQGRVFRKTICPKCKDELFRTMETLKQR